MEYIIEGKVIEGDKYGRVLGFPTANLDTKLENFSPGIYGGKGIIERKIYRAAIVISEDGRVEAHLLGYRGDAYKKVLTLKLKKRLRNYMKFETEQELINQIRKDVKMC